MTWRDTLEACELTEATVRPRYLGPPELPWLRELVEVYSRFEGRPRGELEAWLRDLNSGLGPRPRREAATRVLDRLWSTRIAAPITPSQAREDVFLAAADGEPRSHVLARVAQQRGCSVADVESSLFADLPDRRLVVAPKQTHSLEDLAAQINLALAASLLRRGRRVRVSASAELRRVVRAAKLRGLIVTRTESNSSGEGSDSALHQAQLELTGPLSVLRRTLVYGRALAALLGPLKWCGSFRLDAVCELGPEHGERVLTLSERDPIYPATQTNPWDSKLEQRFQKDFEKVSDDWLVFREPEALPTSDGLMFPDFALIHRNNPFDRWLLEIVGFWTPEYLKSKARALASVPPDVARRFIVCVDEERQAGLMGNAESPHPGLTVIPYRRRVPADRVMAVLRGTPP